MSRTTYVWREGLGLIEKHKAPPPSGVFHAISDTMDAVVHPCTGQMIDSKSRFRSITRAHGCIEVGDQVHAMGRKPDAFAAKRESEARKRDIAEAMRNPDRSPPEAGRRFGISREGWQ